MNPAKQDQEAAIKMLGQQVIDTKQGGAMG